MNRSLCLSLLVLLGLSALAPAVRAADLLLRHVNGYTLDHSGRLQRFQALLVDHGKVVATGTDAALTLRAGHARVIDGGGRTLLPGLTDAHGHVMALDQTLNQADLSATSTLAAALATVKSFAAARPGAPWVRGGGWNQVIWKLGRFPTASELDQAVADRRVWLTRVDGHAGWANSAAMKLAGITRDTVTRPAAASSVMPGATRRACSSMAPRR